MRHIAFLGVAIFLYAWNTVAAAPPAESTITIQVTDKATGDPIAQANVSTNDNQKSATDDYGQCALVMQERGRYFNISVSKTGYVAMQADWQNLQPKQKLPDQLTFNMEPGTSVGGKVVDESGKPVSGATVDLLAPEPPHADGSTYSQFHTTASTNNAGVWSANTAPAQLDTVYYRVNANGYLRTTEYENVPSASQLRDCSFVMTVQHAATLTGTVLDPAGKPVAKATIIAGDASPIDFIARARSDFDGTFTLNNLRPGPIAFAVTSDRFAPQLVTTTVPATQPTEVRLPPGTPMKFHVVNRSGNPVAGVNIFVAQYQNKHYVRYTMKTNGDGNATWNGGPPDEIVMNFWKKSYGMIVDRPTTATTKPIQIVLGAKTHVIGTVTDALTGKPIEHFTVMPGVINPVYGIDHTYWNNESWAGTVAIGQNGGFTYSPNQPYPLYQLRVQAPGYLSCDSAPFDNVSDELAIQFKLVKGVGITGTVFDANHKPLPGAIVHLVLSKQPLQIQNHGLISDSRQQSAPMQSDSAGHFGFELQVGAFDLVCATPEGYARVDAPALHPEKAPSGMPERAQKQPTTRPSSYDLILQPWGTVKGKLMVGSKTGSHVELGLQMINSNSDGHQPQVYIDYLLTTDADGQFSFDHVPPGKVQVCKLIHMGDMQISSAMKTLDIKPAETATVHVGGMGRPVVGKFAIPSTFPRNNWVAWNASFNPHIAHLKGPPMPDMPLSIRTGSNEARLKWLEQWIKTPEGKALIAAQKKWFTTPEGNALLAEAKKSGENVGLIGFSFAVQPDGTFRIDDVPAGSYEIFTQFFPAGIMNGGGDWNHPLGMSRKEIVVPPMPGGRSDDPLDIGIIPVSNPQPSNN